MKIINLITNEVNQNGYNFNLLTKNKMGFLYTAPVNIVPEDCLACDGYVLKIEDYKKLYAVIVTTFNTGDETEDEFRIPDYNITKRFLQPGNDVGIKVAAGLPNITGGNTIVSPYQSNTYGAFAKTSGSQNIHGGGEWYSISNFDASRSFLIYGSSTTVQPPSQIVHICIKYK